MSRDYRQELEKAARQMILIHRVDTLIRLILRTIVRNLKVEHAGIFLYDKKRQEYVVKVSRGKKGLKLPAGFAKIGKDNATIRYFTEERFKCFNQDYLLYSKLNYYIRRYKKKEEKDILIFLEELKEEMSLFQARACIPGFFRRELIGVLFLGRKEDRKKFRKEELGFLSVLSSDVVMALQNAWLFEDLKKQLEDNKRLFLNTVTTLATAIEAKDKYTIGHTERVVKYSLAIAGVLKKNDNSFKEHLRIAALLHDIGKIGVPENILNKKGKLTEEEREFIFKHPLVGEGILRPIGEFKDVIVGVKFHHERYDGKGYPCGLKGKRVPLIAGIIAVADAFDAMSTQRPYKPALSKEEAIVEIKRNRGKQFIPKVVDAFLKAVKENKI